MHSSRGYINDPQKSMGHFKVLFISKSGELLHQFPWKYWTVKHFFKENRHQIADTMALETHRNDLAARPVLEISTGLSIFTSRMQENLLELTKNWKKTD